MDPAPLCKTAILSFIIDETITKFWNVSSISRKRAQMVVEDRHIIIREYNESALKINGWVKIGKHRKSIGKIEEIKKGVSNYDLNNQEQVEKVVSLNGKLRCCRLNFNPEAPIEFDYIQNLFTNPDNYDLYSNCSFNKAYLLYLANLSFIQIKKIITNFKQITNIWIEDCSISNLDLNSLNADAISFDCVTFTEAIYMPSNLQSLEVNDCENTYFLNAKKVREIGFSENESGDSFDWIKTCKELKIACIEAPFSKYMNYLPNTVRQLASSSKIDHENIELSDLKKKLPLLTTISTKIPIEIAQILNLRTFSPVINETKEKLTVKPRKIIIEDYNVEQLNEHPELFEKVEKIDVYCSGFNFDCLPDKIKFIYFHEFSIEGDKLESLERNNWKFEKSEICLSYILEDQARKILNCLKKVRKVKTSRELTKLRKIYPDLKFSVS